MKVVLEIEADENEVLGVINGGNNGDNSADYALMWLIVENIQSIGINCEAKLLNS